MIKVFFAGKSFFVYPRERAHPERRMMLEECQAAKRFLFDRQQEEETKDLSLQEIPVQHVPMR